MRWIIAGIVIAFVAILVVGAVRGRVRARSCCSIAPAAEDLRLREDS